MMSKSSENEDLWHDEESVGRSAAVGPQETAPTFRSSDVIIETLGHIVSNEQLRQIEETGKELALVIQRYKVSETSISEEEAEELASEEPQMVFSLLAEDGTGLHPGFLSGCVSYYACRVPFTSPPSPYPYTEVFLPCVVCGGDANLNDDEDNCGNCEEGTLLFDLAWDAAGVVTATKFSLL